MPVNVNATSLTMIPIGAWVILGTGVDFDGVIPDNATGVYFQFRSGTGFYKWGESAPGSGSTSGFRGNSDQEIRLDLYPGCPIFFGNNTGQIAYQFFTTGDSDSALTRRGR